jgi:hypothetical protein
MLASWATAMDDRINLESRVTTLEKGLAEVRQRLGVSASMQEWLRRISGRFKNDADFDEIVRLGREIRQADQADDSE